MIYKKITLALALLLPIIGISQINDTIELPVKKAIILVFNEKPVFQLGHGDITLSVQENKLIIRYAYPNTKNKNFDEYYNLIAMNNIKFNFFI